MSSDCKIEKKRWWTKVEQQVNFYFYSFKIDDQKFVFVREPKKKKMGTLVQMAGAIVCLFIV